LHSITAALPLPSLICPACRAPLDPEDETVTCGSCGSTYAKEGHWDFAPELEYADLETPCHVEEQGERLRAERFYMPLLRELADEAGKPVTELRVLDDGCGFGAGIEYLRSQGVDAVGVDVGWRSREWRGRDPAWPYMRADGRALPFADASFDAVVSFGVIEHVGIVGESGVSEEVASDYQAHRGRYVSEALRVLRNPGLAVLSQPNGSCPVDFWHYAGRVPARWHSPTQPFLPRFRELSLWARDAEPGVRVEAVSPHRLLAFERVRAWWYGRLFAGVMRAWLAALRFPPLRFFARSPLNPFLVVLVRKPPIRSRA
jgi:SAM-dependent methyltransferase